MPRLMSATAPLPLLATYANYCEVGHNALEFLLHFGQYLPEQSSIHPVAQIVTGPVQTKLFSRLLADAVRQFEDAHGPIADMGDDAIAALFPPGPEFEARARALRSAAPASPIPPHSPSVR